jgi:copper chaperone CopZ
MRKLFLCAVLAALLGAFAQAEVVKLRCDGVKCDQCADTINDALAKVPGVKVTKKATKAEPNTTVDVDLKKADLGKLGKAIADADTPHKDVEAPGAYIILDAPGLTKANAKGVDRALKGVKGVNAALSNADTTQKQLVIKIDGSGSAKLADIKKALATYLKK